MGTDIMIRAARTDEFAYRRVLGVRDWIDHTAGTVRFAAGWTAKLIGAYPGPEGVIVEYAHADVQHERSCASNNFVDDCDCNEVT